MHRNDIKEIAYVLDLLHRILDGVGVFIARSFEIADIGTIVNLQIVAVHNVVIAPKVLTHTFLLLLLIRIF